MSETETHLNDEQLTRAEALRVARNMLGTVAPFAGSKLDRFTVGDLTYLAEWVLGERQRRSGHLADWWKIDTPTDPKTVPVDLMSSDDEEADAEHRAARSDMDDGN
jgi:hypothetical protein